MFAKEPSIPRRWPLYRGLRVIFCQCCDWLYFFFIAVIIFFSSLVWLAGDKLFFFLCPCCRAGSCQPWAPGFIPWLLTHDVMLAGPFHFPLALLALL